MQVIVADDQKAVRSALGLVLDEDPAFDVAAEAGDAAKLLQLVRTQAVDLVLVDWELPGLDGNHTNSRAAASFLNGLRAKHPHVRVIVMSSHPESRHSALTAGADAFICKGDPPEHLLLALKQFCAPD